MTRHFSKANESSILNRVDINNKNNAKTMTETEVWKEEFAAEIFRHGDSFENYFMIDL